MTLLPLHCLFKEHCGQETVLKTMNVNSWLTRVTESFPLKCTELKEQFMGIFFIIEHFLGPIS